VGSEVHLVNLTFKNPCIVIQLWK